MPPTWSQEGTGNPNADTVAAFAEQTLVLELSIWHFCCLPKVQNLSAQQQFLQRKTRADQRRHYLGDRVARGLNELVKELGKLSCIVMRTEMSSLERRYVRVPSRTVSNGTSSIWANRDRTFSRRSSTATYATDARTKKYLTVRPMLTENRSFGTTNTKRVVSIPRWANRPWQWRAERFSIMTAPRSARLPNP